MKSLLIGHALLGFKGVCSLSVLFCLFVILHWEEDFLLTTELHKLARPSGLNAVWVGNDTLTKLLQLRNMSFLKLLYWLKCSCLIVCHVLVPCFVELLELKFLGTLYRSQLLLLCNPHIFGLSCALHLAQLFESVNQPLGPLVLPVFLAAFAKFIHDPREWKEVLKHQDLLQKGDKFLIWQEVHTLFGKEHIIHLAIRLTQVLTGWANLRELRGLCQLLLNRGIVWLCSSFRWFDIWLNINRVVCQTRRRVLAPLSLLDLY